MAKPSNDNAPPQQQAPSDDVLKQLLELQQQTATAVSELRRRLGAQGAMKGPRKRRGPVVYSPPETLPGPEPSEMQRAWAKKLLRQYGWR